MVLAAAPGCITAISPRPILSAEFVGSTPVTRAVTFHHVQRSVAPTKTAAHECAGVVGLFGSFAQEVILAAPSLVAERIPTSSAPVGTRAKAVPTEVKPLGGQVGDGDGLIAFRTRGWEA